MTQTLEMKLILRQPTNRTRDMEWIKVTERLPEHERSVLVIVLCDDGSTYDIAHYDENRKRWFDESDYDASIYPTHWQPLPAQPDKSE